MGMLGMLRTRRGLRINDEVKTSARTSRQALGPTIREYAAQTAILNQQTR